MEQAENGAILKENYLLEKSAFCNVHQIINQNDLKLKSHVALFLDFFDKPICSCLVLKLK